MFDQRKYVNNYLKDTYRPYKLRVRKDDDEVIAKLEGVDNVNAYLLSLIRKDIEGSRKWNYINGSVPIDFPLSDGMNELIKEAERGDREDDYGLYMNYACAIDTRAKNEVQRGKLTDAQWDTLCRRFPL